MQTSNYGENPQGQILIAVGANLPSGDQSPLETCIAALDALEDMAVRVICRSRWYKTAPVPLSAQPWFINGVAALDCHQNPAALLKILHAVENRFGRMRAEPSAARSLDLDLLDYRGSLSDGNPPPELPHPRLAERAFVLLPMAEVAPGWIHPRSGKEIADLIDALGPGQIAEPMD